MSNTKECSDKYPWKIIINGTGLETTIAFEEKDVACVEKIDISVSTTNMATATIYAIMPEAIINLKKEGVTLYGKNIIISGIKDLIKADLLKIEDFAE